MEREDDKELWDILGHTAEATLSPLFARNVLRKIRQEASPFERTPLLRKRNRIGLAGGRRPRLPIIRRQAKIRSQAKVYVSGGLRFHRQPGRILSATPSVGCG